MPAPLHSARDMPRAAGRTNAQQDRTPAESGVPWRARTGSRNSDCKTTIPAITAHSNGFEPHRVSRMFTPWQNHCETALENAASKGWSRGAETASIERELRGKTPSACAIRREVGVAATVPNHPFLGGTTSPQRASRGGPAVEPVARRMRFLFAGSPIPVS